MSLFHVALIQDSLEQSFGQKFVLDHLDQYVLEAATRGVL